MPHTKSIDNGLYELRIKGQEVIARVFYCIMVGKEIINFFLSVSVNIKLSF